MNATPYRLEPRSPWKGLRLKNFRNFEDTSPIELAPITVLFGKNSSGKTTLLRAPILLRQCLEAPVQAKEVPFTGHEVDFGSYKDVVFRGQLARDVAMEFDFRPSDMGQRFLIEADVPLAERLSTSGGRLTVDFHWNMRDSRSQTQKIQLYAADLADPLLVLTRKGPTSTRLEFPTTGFGRTVTGVPELSLASFPYVGRAVTQSKRELIDIDFLLFVLSDILRELSSSYTHIGPLRDKPARAYRLDHAGPEGTASVDVVNLLSRNRRALARVSRGLTLLGMARGVHITKPAPGFAGIELTSPTNGQKFNLADLGFGVSQVLPVLARIAAAPRGSRVAIEQPELHLHPQAQGSLATALVELASEVGVDLFIESHSEHILLRLQRLIAEGLLSAESVAIYVTDHGKVERAALDEFGKLDHSVFPENFFQEEWLDTLAMAREAARRKSEPRD